MLTNRRLLKIALYALAYACGIADAGPSRYMPVDAVAPDRDLAPLIFVVDAPFAVRSVVLENASGSRTAGLELTVPASTWTARVFMLPVGRYRIVAINVPDFQRKPIKIVDAPWVELNAGQLNYVGDLELYTKRGEVLCRLVNRSGRLLVNLRQTAREVAGSGPLVFVGGEDDGWVMSLGRTE